MKRPTILWFGDAACVTTGFGRVANSVLNGLHATNKYNIVQFGLNYYGDPHIEPFKIYPIRQDDIYGRKRLLEIVMKVEPDILITNNDIWALTWVKDVISTASVQLNKRIQWIAYFPIDGEPVKPEWVKLIRDYVDIPITYTQWAVDAIKKVADTDFTIPYIYHGVDTTIFHPEPDIKKEFKRKISKELNRDVNFVIGYVGRNQPRKRLPELLLAFRHFYEDHPDSLLYLHTTSPDRGWNLRSVMKTVGLPSGSAIIAPRFSVADGIPDDLLATLYQTFDVLALPTIGEGFGLPLVEGMASGCAILSSNCSVVPEIVGKAGVLTNTSYFEIMIDDNELVRPIPSPTEISAGMSILYKNGVDSYGAEGVRRAKELFGTWHIDEWCTYIDKAMENVSEIHSQGMLNYDIDDLFEGVE